MSGWGDSLEAVVILQHPQSYTCMYMLYMPCRFYTLKKVSLQEEKDKLKLKFDKYMLENKTINYLIIFFKSMTIPHAYQNLFCLRQLCQPCISSRNTMCVIWINKFIRWEGFPNRTITEPKGI